jgi:hypothetical protein
LFFTNPKETSLQVRARIAAKNLGKTVVVLSRSICPGGVGFETSSAKGTWAQGWLQMRHDQSLMG